MVHHMNVRRNFILTARSLGKSKALQAKKDITHFHNSNIIL